MPVRIYDISKKLGLENKEVLAKAKELGIAAARVASSSLDKITAEYLEQQLILAYPERTAPPAPAATVEIAPGPAQPAQAIKQATAITTVVPEGPKVHLQEVTTSTATASPALERSAETLAAAPPVEIPAP